VRLPRPSPPAYRRLALTTLVSLVAITVVGAGVRLTGSGLGCSTWPSCEPDSFTPRSASDVNAMIEFVNRLLNVAVGLVAIAAVVGANRRRPRRPDLVRWSLAVLAWVVVNGLVGAIVVRLHLTPVSVIGHFVLALGAIWSAVVLHQRAGEAEPRGGPARHAATEAFVLGVKLLLAASAVVVLTGTVVTGTGPHAGDEQAERLGFDIGTVVQIHGLSMVVFLLLTVAVLRMAHRGDAAPVVVQRGHELLVVLVAQAALGYWQYFTGVPALLVAFHVLGAAVVWIAVLRLWLSLGMPEVADVAVRTAGTDEAATAAAGSSEAPDAGAAPHVATM